MKGSMTVEAAYIFPICFLILGVVCYLGIFQYDRAVLKLTGYECILQVLEERDAEDEVLQSHLKKDAEEKAVERLFGASDVSVTVKITATKICVDYECMEKVLKIPLKVSIVYERTFPELTLRIGSG